MVRRTMAAALVAAAALVGVQVAVLNHGSAPVKAGYSAAGGPSRYTDSGESRPR